MAQDDSLLISAPRQGIGSSPHTGFADVRNLDISSIPGVAKLNRALTKRSESVVTSSINWAVENPLTSGEVFALGDNGNVYWSTSVNITWTLLNGNSLVNAHGNGLAIWEDYLFVARDTSLDTFGPLTQTTSTVFTATLANPMVITRVAHGLTTNDRIILYSTGFLRSSASVDFANQGTAYFVEVVDPDTFNLASTIGGNLLNSSVGSQNGVHTYKFWKTKNTTNDLSFQTNVTSDVLWHPMLVSKLDGKLFGGSANQVFKLVKNSGQTFAPQTSATYTWSPTALTTAIPSGYRIKCLAELGSNLMLGTWWGTAVNSFPIADIFPWDTSDLPPGNPIILNDFGCHAMLTYGNSLIILAGVNGTIYKSDGVNFAIAAKLPIEMNYASGAYVIWSPGAIFSQNGKVFMGSAGSGVLAPQGIYSLHQTPQGNILNLEHLVSYLTDGTTVTTGVTAMLPLASDRLLAGTFSDTTEGIDTTTVGSFFYNTDYSGFFTSPLYVVGSPKSLRVFTELNILFAKELATNEGIQISYRLNLTDSFTVLGTFSSDIAGTTKIGAVNSHFVNPGIPKCETIQLKIALKGTTTTTPQLKSITLK